MYIIKDESLLSISGGKLTATWDEQNGIFTLDGNGATRIVTDVPVPNMLSILNFTGGSLDGTSALEGGHILVKGKPVFEVYVGSSEFIGSTALGDYFEWNLSF